MLEKEWNELTEDSPSDQFMFRLTQSSGKPVRDWSDEQIVEGLKLWKSDPATEEFIRDILEHGRRKDLLQLLTPEKYYFPHGSSVSISKSARYVQNGEFHDHDYFEIECVLEGEADHHSLLGDYGLAQGDIVLIPPHVKHDLDVRDKGTIINLGIRSSTFRSEFADILKNDIGIASYFENIMYGTFNHEILIKECLDDFMVELILMLYQKQKQYPSENDLISSHLMASFLFRMFERSRPNLMVDITQSSNTKINQIRKYIDEHCDTVTLSELSEAFYMSSAYISRFLKAKLHTGFSDLVRESRINRAKELLIKTDQSVLEISQQIGYSSQSHFIALFHEMVGSSPLQYRLNKMKTE